MFCFRSGIQGSKDLTGYSIILALTWSVLLLVIVLWGLKLTREDSQENAHIYTKVGFDKDILYRLWAACHGGVYVPVSEYPQPNPYLTDIPERDIKTLPGIQLTLMNPAYMTRQIYKLEKQNMNNKNGGLYYVYIN